MRLSTITGIPEDVRTNLPSEELLVNDRSIGIEFEVENYKVSDKTELEYSLISCKDDGSLRNNGREIVTIPVKGKDIILAIDQVLELCSRSGSVVECSPRCGLHVHIDMRDCSLEQLSNVVALFCIMEGELFNYCGANRDTNPYCLPLNNHILSGELYTRLFSEEANKVADSISRTAKYTSLNLLPLFRLGTIEIRMHEGTIEREKIIEWVNMLLSLVNYGINFNKPTQDIIDSVCSSFKELVHNTFQEIGIKSTHISGHFLETAIEGARNFQRISALAQVHKNTRSMPKSRVSSSSITTNPDVTWTSFIPNSEVATSFMDLGHIEEEEEEVFDPEIDESPIDEDEEVN